MEMVARLGAQASVSNSNLQEVTSYRTVRDYYRDEQLSLVVTLDIL
jgi:hypothetical protein